MANGPPPTRLGIRRGSVPAIVAFCLTTIAAAPGAADEVRLDNGDVIRGKVTGADDKSVTIKHVYGDDVVVPLDKVAAIQTDEPVTLRLLDGSKIKGKLKPGPLAGQIAVETKEAGTIPKIDREHVAGIGDIPDAVWSGKIALGVTITDGNTQGKSFFASFDAERRTKQDFIEAHAFYTYAETFGAMSARRSYARLQYSYFVLHPLYLYAGAALEYDRLRDLNLRSRGGGGLGAAWIDEPTIALRTEAGAEYVNEDYRNSEDRRFASLRGALTFDWQITDWVKFREFFEIFPSTEEFSRYVTHSETSVSFALTKGFGLAGVVLWDHVSKPPPGREKNDEQYIITLTYSF